MGLTVEENSALPWQPKIALLITLLLGTVFFSAASSALGEKPWQVKASPKAFPLVAKNLPTTLVVDAQDFPGVKRAAQNLQTDIENVTGKKPSC